MVGEIGEKNFVGPFECAGQKSVGDNEVGEFKVLGAEPGRAFNNLSRPGWGYRGQRFLNL